MQLRHYLIIFVIVFLPLFAKAYMKIDNLQVMDERASNYNETIDNAVDDSLNSLIETQDSLAHQINLETCSDTFFKSIFAGFGVTDSPTGKQQLQMYVPLLLVTDSDGFYVMYHSMNSTKSKTSRVWSTEQPYCASGYLTPKSSGAVETPIKYQIRFTMSDKIHLSLARETEAYTYEGLYNTFLSENADIGSAAYELLKKFWTTATITKANKDAAPDPNKTDWGFLAKDCWNDFRQSTMIYQITKKMNYYVNEHNAIARQFGISYTFDLPESSMDSFARTIDSISLLAIFQGYPYGSGTDDVYSRFSVSGARLYRGDRYVVTNGAKDGENTPLIYHRSSCANLSGKTVISAYSSKEACASDGAYPCPYCKP